MKLVEKKRKLSWQKLAAIMSESLLGQRIGEYHEG